MDQELTDGSVSGRRERKRADRRRAMLRVAAEVFRARGFGGASAEEIAERLDMAKGNLFYHFGSKHGLLAACHEESLERMIALLRTVRAEVATPDDALRSALEGLAELASDDLDGAALHTDPRVLPAEARARVEARWAELEAEVAALLDWGARAGALGETGPLGAGLVLRAIAGAAARAPRNVDPAELAATLASLLLDGLRTRGARRPPPARPRGFSNDPEEWLRR